MAEQLAWDILARDHMSEVLEKLARASDKLERSLNKTGNEGRQMGRQLDEAEPKARKLSGGLEHLGNAAATAVGWLKNVGVTAGLALGSAAVAAGAFAIKTAADNETARVSFDLLLGSSEKAGAFLKDLQAFSAATPFDMPTLRDASSRLLAVGVNAKDVIPIMTRLGDATAGMGTGAEGIQRAVYALQQMRQSGKVQLDDINQLTDAGIPALDALAAHFHTTVAKVRDNISAGKIKADDLFAAIERGEGPAFTRLKGMMDKQSGTLTGIWSTFKDNASQALAGFVEPAMPKLKELVNLAAGAVPKAMSGLADIGKSLHFAFGDSAFLQRFWGALRKAGDEILPVLRKGWDELMRVIHNNREGLEKFGNLIINDVIPALTWLTKTVIGGFVVGASAAIVAVAAFGEHFQQMKHIVVEGARILLDGFLSAVGGILHGAAIAFGWIPGLGPKLQAAATAFDAFYAKANAALNKLDGRQVNFYVIEHFGVIDTSHRAGERGGGPPSVSAGRMRGHDFLASGGLTPAASGVAIRVGENGPEELYQDGGGWRVRPNHAMSAGTSAVDVVDVPLRFRNAVTGEVVQEALLRLARGRGYRTVAQLLPLPGGVGA